MTSTTVRYSTRDDAITAQGFADALKTTIARIVLLKRLRTHSDSSLRGIISMPKTRIKAGLLGLGKVGTKLSLQHAPESDRFRFHWLSDSKRIYRSKNPNGFSKRDIQSIIKFKQHKLTRKVPSYDIYEFENVNRQVSLLHDLVSVDKGNWIIFDTTFTGKQNDFAIADAMMGCKAYCTGNKTAWADFDSCSTLLEKAREKRTLLGLNTTVGVWLDQMEILPIMMQNFTEGQINILKRDNSSLNLFFAKIGRGLTVEKTIRDLEESGHLDLPGPDALLTEVKDQTMKAHIAANICGVMSSIKPVFRDQPPTGADGPRSIDPSELAEWHLRGRRGSDYSALVCEIIINLQTASINYEVSFMQLPNRHPLAKDFLGKCAMAIDTNAATFTWSKKKSLKHTHFVRSGYGGAKRTAARLIDEANRAITISQRKPRVSRSPILVLSALEKAERAARVLEKELALVL